MQHRPQLAAGGGELVQVASAVVGVGRALEDPLLDQTAEPLGEHCLGDVEVLLEVVEARTPYSASRTISKVQRSPTTSSARAIAQS